LLTPQSGGDIIKNEFIMDWLTHPFESIKQTKPDCKQRKQAQSDFVNHQPASNNKREDFHYEKP